MDPVRIEWLQPDGRGVGRGPHGLVRVRGGIPGDHLEIRAVERRGRTVDAQLVSIAQPSPARVQPTCLWDARCGGCDLAAFEPSARREALARMVAYTLGVPTPEVTPSPRSTGHRARVKLTLQDGRPGYRAARSHEHVAIERCEIARPEVGELLGRLRHPDLADALRKATSVELRSNGSVTACAFEGAPKAPDGLESLGNVAWNGRAIAGCPSLELEVLGQSLRASPRAFFQVNLEANLLLVQHVVDAVVQFAPERVLDLYAGIGNLTLPLAAATRVTVAAVEIEGDGIADLRHNAARSGLPIEAIGCPVERHDPSVTPFDVAVLDPPRAGARGVLGRLVRQRPRGVVYVSCDIRSARRDLPEALKAGYAIRDVRCFDMFPGTHHIETVIVLERR